MKRDTAPLRAQWVPGRLPHLGRLAQAGWQAQSVTHLQKHEMLNCQHAPVLLGTASLQQDSLL